MAVKITKLKLKKAYDALTSVVQADDVLDHMSPVGLAYLARARKTLAAYVEDEEDG